MNGNITLMRKYTNNVIERYIYIDDKNMTDYDKDQFVLRINNALWYAIQETNAYVEGRVLPYIIVRRVIKDESKIRVIINDSSIDDFQTVSEYAKTKELNIKDVSHIITFKTLSPHNIIRVSDDLKPGTAEVWTDRQNQIAAAVDIFLDIAMFNSVSYLKDKLSNKNKKEFNQIKYTYFQEQKYESYFYIQEDDPPSYISFSFAFRTDTDTIDYYAYVNCWEEFLASSHIKGRFPNIVCNVNPPEIQVKDYIYPKQLPDKCFTSEYWDKYENGDYLLLRINSSPNTNIRKNRIQHYFGVRSYHDGPIKIVPIYEYFKPFIRQDINEGNIAAFKVVVKRNSQ